MLKLAHGLTFADLYSIEGPRRIDALFVGRICVRPIRHWPTGCTRRARAPDALARRPNRSC